MLHVDEAIFWASSIAFPIAIFYMING